MLFYSMLAAANGGIVTLSRLINSALGSYIGSLNGSFVNHIVGALFAAILLLVGLGNGQIHFQGIPIYYFIGGMLGVFLVTFNNYAVPFLGAAAVAILMLFAQLLTSSLIDHFGLLGARVLPLSLLKLAGLSFLLLGSILVIKGRTPDQQP